MENCTKIEHCLCCIKENILFIDFGEQPPANSYHTKNEKFYIFNGKIKILLKNILTNKRYEVLQNSKDSKVFRSIPGWAHALKNLTSNIIYGVVWSNEIFNKKKPDTIKELL